MLNNIKRLINRSVLMQTACEAALMRIAREDEDLQQQQTALEDKLDGLRVLLSLKELANKVVSREKIFTLLRRIAVIQQQMAGIELQISQIKEKRAELVKQRQLQLEKRKIWWLKENKYQRLKKRVLRNKLVRQLQQEEMEQEEKYNDINR